ncbi:MAG: hypothetical protein C4533_07365 [Candidatus Omnitrophota bacterium]|jgi:predicted permease|nr:MAG: hypothetical protein C4533_07365 [Candidatus Omnitrophota bacterium]
MFIEYAKITGSAVGQIFLLAAIGFFLVKKELLGREGLNALSRLVIEVTLPAMIFCQLVKDFSFSLYGYWWVFPLASIAITVFGFMCALPFAGFFKEKDSKIQFISLIGFQNSGYLPLALVAAILSENQLNTMFIYLFLFLLGFNLLMWSVGVYLINLTSSKRFDFASLFSPPVLATIISLVLVAAGLNKAMPEMLLKPLNMVGECTLPLAMFVVGGNLAQIKLHKVSKRAVFLVTLLKLVIMPALGLWLLISFNVPKVAALLVLIQLAMPPATSLSVITSSYNKEDKIISQGIFFGHIFSIVSIPVFLSLYFYFSMIK